MPKLKINDIPVSLGSAKIALSKSAYSFSDWISKTVTFSRRVRIPQTEKLNSITKRPQSPEIIANKFNELYSFEYSDNNKIIFSGAAQLLATNTDGITEWQLLDKSKELFNNLRNDLNALNLESSDFIFNTASYDTLKVLNSSVWIWAACSMHEKKVLSNNILSGNLAFARPFFSVKKLFDVIFSSNKWTYTLSTNAEFLNSLIVSARAEFVFTSWEKIYNSTIIVAGIHTLDLSIPEFNKTDTSTATTLSLNNNSKIRLRGVIESSENAILKISGVSSLATDTQIQEFPINQGIFSYDITSNAFTTDDPTYDVQITIEGNTTVIFTDFLVYTVIDENDFGNISLAGFVDYKVKTYDNLPDITQIELYKHALVSVGGFFSTDNYRKQININTLKGLSKLSAKNWSKKLIENSVQSYPLTGYGKINYFSYDNNNSMPDSLGRGTFHVDANTLPDTVTVYESIFSGAKEVEITDVQIDFDKYDNIERINDIDKVIGTYEVNGLYTVAKFAPLDGNKILNTFYTGLLSSVNNGDVLQANFNLNKSDFFLFDFTQLLYLEQYKSSFYVLNISDYMEGRSTKIILLKKA